MYDTDVAHLKSHHSAYEQNSISEFQVILVYPKIIVIENGEKRSEINLKYYN